MAFAAWSRPLIPGMNRPTTSSLMNLSMIASSSTTPRAATWEKRLSKIEKSRGAIPSAMPVEPRTSANNIDSSTSAPPWFASMSC